MDAIRRLSVRLHYFVSQTIQSKISSPRDEGGFAITRHSCGRQEYIDKNQLSKKLSGVTEGRGSRGVGVSTEIDIARGFWEARKRGFQRGQYWRKWNSPERSRSGKRHRGIGNSRDRARHAGQMTRRMGAKREEANRRKR